MLRIARPSDQMETVANMYMAGLGFKLLARFENHGEFDGIIIGHPHAAYHLEFTHHHGSQPGRAPTQDNLLVFYVPDREEWLEACEGMVQAGFKPVASFNPYWEVQGQTFEDPDGYRVVVQNREWSL